VSIEEEDEEEEKPTQHVLENAEEIEDKDVPRRNPFQEARALQQTTFRNGVEVSLPPWVLTRVPRQHRVYQEGELQKDLTLRMSIVTNRPQQAQTHMHMVYLKGARPSSHAAPPTPKTAREVGTHATVYCHVPQGVRKGTVLL
jgi:hypothetical protein